jgi:hypothetical protein
MHDPARHLDVANVPHCIFDGGEFGEQLLQRQHAAVVVDLQRPDTWRKIDDAAELARFEARHQHVGPEA